MLSTTVVENLTKKFQTVRLPLERVIELIFVSYIITYFNEHNCRSP